MNSQQNPAASREGDKACNDAQTELAISHHAISNLKSN
jgi:hypothetical protein